MEKSNVLRFVTAHIPRIDCINLSMDSLNDFPPSIQMYFVSRREHHGFERDQEKRQQAPSIYRLNRDATWCVHSVGEHVRLERRVASVRANGPQPECTPYKTKKSQSAESSTKCDLNNQKSASPESLSMARCNRHLNT